MDAVCVHSSQSSQSYNKTPEEELLTEFIQDVEIQFALQDSTPSMQQLPKIQPLASKLRELLNIRIPKSQQKIFIEYLLKYVEICLGFVSTYGDLGYRKQRDYASLLLGFIPEFFNTPDIKNMFVKEATVKIFDLFMYGRFTTISKKELLRVLNRIADQTEKQVRMDTAKNIIYHMYTLIDCLSTYGDYVMQSDIMETLYRIFGSEIRNNQMRYALLPGSKELSDGLLMEISVDDFDADVRRWLNKFNSDSQLIFSIACRTLVFGNVTCNCPDEGPEGIWLDFDLKDNIISFYSTDINSGNWNRIIIMTKDVKKVEVKRQFKPNENTNISLYLSKPCISDLTDNQVYWDSLDKHLKIIVSNDEKDKINKLISQVLPRLFGDRFLHTSARISDKIKKVYKPLGIKISKRKPSTSEISSGTSNSRSDVANIVSQPELPKQSAIRVMTSPTSKSKTDDSSISYIKHSKPKPNSSLQGDVSMVATDFTVNSGLPSEVTSGPISVISYDCCEVSRPSSSDKMDQELQGNIVTSSCRIDSDIPTSSRIEILSGQCSGNHPVYFNDNIHFQSSEVFSSSPLKRPKCVMKLISDDEFHSADSESVEQQKDDFAHQIKKPTDTKISTLIMSEDVLDDEFETAVENLDELEYIATEPAKGESKDYKNTKISHYINRPDVDNEEPIQKDISTVNPDCNSKKVSKLIPHSLDSRSTVVEVHSSKCDEDTISDNCQKLKRSKASTKKLSYDSDYDDVPLSRWIQNKPADSALFSAKETDGILTPDLFEMSTQVNGISTANQENIHHSESNSEDIFSRDTQPNTVMNDQSGEQNFTELSLTVNVGILDSQRSEELVQVIQPIIVSSKDNYSDKIIEIPQRDVADTDGKIEETIDLTSQDKDPIIDLTDEVDIVPLIQEAVHFMAETSSVNLKLADINSKVTQSKPLLNTPELIVILAQDGSQCVPSKDLVASGEANAFMEDENKDILVNKKKPRHLIKTGKKQFRLVHDEELVINQFLVETKERPLDVRLEKMSIADSKFQSEIGGGTTEDHQTENLSSDTDPLEISESQLMKATKKQPIIYLERIINRDEKLLEPVIEKAPKRNLRSNVKLINTLKKSDENIALSGASDFIQKKRAKPLLSDEDFNMENCDVIDLSDQPKAADEGRELTQVSSRSSGIIQKKTAKRLLSDNELVDVEDANVIDIRDEPKTVDEGNVLSQMSGVVQKKSARRLLSEEELDVEDANVIDIQQLETAPDKNVLSQISGLSGFIQKKTAKPIPSEAEINDPNTNLVSNAGQSDAEDAKDLFTSGKVLPKEQTGNEANDVKWSPPNKPTKKATKVSRVVKKSKKRPMKNAKNTKTTIPLQTVHETNVDQSVLKNTNTLNQQDENIPIQNDIEAPKDKTGEVQQAAVDSFVNNQPNVEYEIPKPGLPEFKEGSILPEPAVAQEVVSSFKENQSEVNQDVVSATNDIASDPKPLPEATSYQEVEPPIFGKRRRLSSIEIPSQTILVTAQINYNENDNRNSIQENNNESQKNLEKEIHPKTQKYVNQDLDLITIQNSPILQKGSKRIRRSLIDFDNFLNDAEKFAESGNTVNRQDLINKPTTSPILRGNKSKEPVTTKSPDIFDVLLAEYAGTNNASENRKLYNPDNFADLDPLQSTPDLASTPTAVTQGAKPKQRKPRTKKQTEKIGTARKSNKENKPKGTSKGEVKKRKPRKPRKEFSVSTAPFLTTEELFDLTCGDFLNEPYAYGYNARQFNQSNLNQPMDVVVRSEPISPDQSVVHPNRVGQKKSSPELPQAIQTPKTPRHSSDFSWPELEVVPVTNKQAPKINILQDIVIKSKRPIQEESSYAQTPKKVKLDVRGDVEEHVPLPTLLEEESRANNLAPPVEKGEDILSGFVNFVKFVIRLIEAKRDAEALRKLNQVVQFIERLE